jgi:hypothetical protein
MTNDKFPMSATFYLSLIIGHWSFQENQSGGVAAALQISIVETPRWGVSTF